MKQRMKEEEKKLNGIIVTSWRISGVFLPMCISLKMIVVQSCQILCKPTDCSLTGSLVHGISQERIL